jgi:predicted  nucleic acid-binding Zn-ribbon protein
MLKRVVNFENFADIQTDLVSSIIERIGDSSIHHDNFVDAVVNVSDINNILNGEEEEEEEETVDEKIEEGSNTDFVKKHKEPTNINQWSKLIDNLFSNEVWEGENRQHILAYYKKRWETLSFSTRSLLEVMHPRIIQDVGFDSIINTVDTYNDVEMRAVNDIVSPVFNENNINTEFVKKFIQDRAVRLYKMKDIPVLLKELSGFYKTENKELTFLADHVKDQYVLKLEENFKPDELTKIWNENYEDFEKLQIRFSSVDDPRAEVKPEEEKEEPDPIRFITEEELSSDIQYISRSDIDDLKSARVQYGSPQHIDMLRKISAGKDRYIKEQEEQIRNTKQSVSELSLKIDKANTEVEKLDKNGKDLKNELKETRASLVLKDRRLDEIKTEMKAMSTKDVTDRLEGEVKDAKEAKTVLESKINSLESEISKAEALHSEQVNKYNALQTQVYDLQQRTGNLTDQEVDDLRVQLKRLRSSINSFRGITPREEITDVDQKEESLMDVVSEIGTGVHNLRNDLLSANTRNAEGDQPNTSPARKRKQRIRAPPPSPASSRAGIHTPSPPSSEMELDTSQPDLLPTPAPSSEMDTSQLDLPSMSKLHHLVQSFGERKEPYRTQGVFTDEDQTFYKFVMDNFPGLTSPQDTVQALANYVKQWFDIRIPHRILPQRIGEVAQQMIRVSNLNGFKLICGFLDLDIFKDDVKSELTEVFKDSPIAFQTTYGSYVTDFKTRRLLTDPQNIEIAVDGQGHSGFIYYPFGKNIDRGAHKIYLMDTSDIRTTTALPQRYPEIASSNITSAVDMVRTILTQSEQLTDPDDVQYTSTDDIKTYLDKFFMNQGVSQSQVLSHWYTQFMAESVMIVRQQRSKHLNETLETIFNSSKDVIGGLRQYYEDISIPNDLRLVNQTKQQPGFHQHLGTIYKEAVAEFPWDQYQGIPPDIQKKILEQTFINKATGKGSHPEEMRLQARAWLRFSKFTRVNNLDIRTRQDISNPDATKIPKTTKWLHTAEMKGNEEEAKLFNLALTTVTDQLNQFISIHKNVEGEGATRIKELIIPEVALLNHELSMLLSPRMIEPMMNAIQFDRKTNNRMRKYIINFLKDTNTYQQQNLPYLETSVLIGSNLRGSNRVYGIPTLPANSNTM